MLMHLRKINTVTSLTTKSQTNVLHTPTTAIFHLPYQVTTKSPSQRPHFSIIFSFNLQEVDWFFLYPLFSAPLRVSITCLAKSVISPSITYIQKQQRCVRYECKFTTLEAIGKDNKPYMHSVSPYLTVDFNMLTLVSRVSVSCSYCPAIMGRHRTVELPPGDLQDLL